MEEKFHRVEGNEVGIWVRENQGAQGDPKGRVGKTESCAAMEPVYAHESQFILKLLLFSALLGDQRKDGDAETKGELVKGFETRLTQLGVRRAWPAGSNASKERKEFGGQVPYWATVQ